MPGYHPRSIVSLILVGFAVVLTPFVFAVVTAVVQVDRFAVGSRTAVLYAGSATDESRALVEEATEMQRALGQYTVRNDADFLNIYLDRREDFREALANLLALDEPGLDTEALRALSDDEAAIYRTIDDADSSVPDGDWQAAVDSLSNVVSQSRAVRRRSDQLVQRAANEFTGRAESLQRTLLVIAAAAAPATVLLIVVFTVLITRPMRELGGAIRRLGAQSLEEPIKVSGPQDVEALAAELEWLRLRIRALEEQKAGFLQHISHELKTPLSTIREGSELLLESLGDDGREEAEIVRLLRENGLQLQQLIEDLLQFAKTQDLALDLEFESAVDLSDLVEEAVDGLGVVAEAKEIEVRARLSSVAVRCDASKIRTVIDNLLTNAIKYTPRKGRIRVELSADASCAAIDVVDSGPGVDPAERRRIFEPFRQGGADYESSVKGTGLGLSIAREYVEAHSGTIELIDSDAGAHFRVILPRAGPAGATSAV